MSEQTASPGDTALFSYVIASADMRYIEVNTRQIYLRDDPEQGLVVRGEIPGCGEGCYADLSQMMLEYALSCDGCREQDVAQSSVVEFGERLGKVLAARLAQDPGRFARAFDCVVRSLGVPFTAERSEASLRYALSTCPLCESGGKTGLKRELGLARQGFAALCQSLLGTLAPDWTMLSPLLGEPQETLEEVVLRRG
jgi:hypothetical protein